MIKNSSTNVIIQELGQRLKQARLNADLTQVEIAELAGLSRKAVLNAEKGKAQLEVFVAILQALNLTDQMENFLPSQEISPLQLVKLQGKKRQRASGQRTGPNSTEHNEEPPEW
ncbi:hypothetical protein TDB9533_01954 [Thalassocella blandensis]|nr:hypothetical protein TDB9533_01954 [Thalassocella blandensis]